MKNLRVWQYFCAIQAIATVVINMLQADLQDSVTVNFQLHFNTMQPLRKLASVTKEFITRKEIYMKWNWSLSTKLTNAAITAFASAPANADFTYTDFTDTSGLTNNSTKIQVGNVGQGSSITFFKQMRLP